MVPPAAVGGGALACPHRPAVPSARRALYALSVQIKLLRGGRTGTVVSTRARARTASGDAGRRGR